MKTFDKTLLKELKTWIDRREELIDEKNDLWSKVAKNYENIEEVDRKIAYLNKEIVGGTKK